LAVNGGNKMTQYNITAGYTDQEGIIMNTGLERYSFRLNLKSELAKRLVLQLNTSYSLIVKPYFNKPCNVGYSLPISQTVLKFQFVNEDVFFISLADRFL
jgi:hypothetical protein